MSSQSMRYLVPFEDQRAFDPESVGQKFAALARARREGFAVPPAVAVVTEAHRYFLSHRRWPEGLREEVTAAADRLGLAQGLSIRSSAVREDLEKQSFAGQYRTFLHVLDPPDIAQKIEQCWLGAESENVRSYLEVGRTPSRQEPVPLMGVVLQRMVQALAAGVAFGRNPLHPARNEVVIEAVAGSAEHLVSGHVSPYRAFVGAGVDLRVVPPRLGDERTSADADGSPLNEDEWRRIAALLRRLETVTGEFPLDIEWAIDMARSLWLLQVRRITTIGASDLDAPPGAWTRHIADDLWADRLTPFMAHAMLTNAPRYNLSRIAKLVGIPTIEHSLAVINGYLYVSCEGIRQAISRIPTRLRFQDLQSLLPNGQAQDEIPSPGALTLLMLGLRGLLLPLLSPEVNPLICHWWTQRRRKRIEKRFGRLEGMPDDDANQTLGRLLFAMETMALIQAGNQWPYFHATFFTWLLRWLVVDRAKEPHGRFLALLSKGSRNVTLDIESWFRRTARWIMADAHLRDLFRQHDAGQVLDKLPADFQNGLSRFLGRYGCRSRHRTLYVPRWVEAPHEVIGILQALVRGGDVETAVGVYGNIEPNASEPSKAYFAPRSSRWLGKPSMAVILKLTRKFLDLREELRFLLDRALLDIRTALLALGGQTGLGEEVMFLDAEELKWLVAGTLAAEKARLVAAERHQRFREPVTVSTFIIDGRPVENFSLTAEVFEGIGTSTGRVTGRARIVTNPSMADIQKGDILVAENTDPGWTPILSLAGGMVMEEGGLLNHCSIVARELGIPAVVGVRQATRRIQEGSLITIDGGLGLVRVEGAERAAAAGL